MEKKHMVYLHRRKTDGSVFYVGIGKGRRPYVTSGRNPHWRNVVAKNGIDVQIVFEGMSEACCKTIERILIHKIGLENLCNITSGGEGTSGWNPSEETRKKISEATKKAWDAGVFDRVWCDSRRLKLSEKNKGILNPMSGKRLTEQHKAKISNSLKGEKNPNYGKSPNEYTRKKISESLMGRKLSDDHKEAISKGQKGRRKSKEEIEKSATSREKKEEFTFVNSSGEMFTGTMRALSRKFKIDRSAITKIVNGKAKSHKGWRVEREFLL